MIEYTSKDYIKLSQIFSEEIAKKLAEEPENKYETQAKSRHHIHDKLFRSILNNKKEIVKTIENHLGKQIVEDKIEKFETKFITGNYEEKEADIVYKIKDKEEYYLIEHQSKIDHEIIFRTGEYSLEIIRSRMVTLRSNLEKYNEIKVIPIVIYTGKQKWKMKNNLGETGMLTTGKIKYGYEEKYGFTFKIGVNIVDIRSKEEAKKERTAIARMSVLERINDINEIINVVEDLLKTIKEKRDQNEFIEQTMYLFKDKLTEEQTKKVETMIKRGGEEEMEHARKVINDYFDKREREGLERGMKQGMQQGIQQGMQQGMEKGKLETARNMLNKKFDIQTIIEITGLKKEEILNAK